MIELKPLPPAEAVAYFRGKGLQESFAWEDVWQEEHARAFTVAKAMRRDVLQDIREAVDKAIAEGRTFQQFRDELRPLLQAKGWWGRRQMTDPASGEQRDVQLGSSRRLRTIFEVNLRTAYAAGRWQRIEATKAALPYLRYVAVMDSRTRPEHRAWHGVVKPVDDPWWDTHFPPCGWRCRCTTVQINARTMERRGWTVTEDPPRFPQRVYQNPRSGEVSVIEGGIDPGFNYHVGKAANAAGTPGPGGAPPMPTPPVSGGRPPITPRPGPARLDPGVTTDEEAVGSILREFGLYPGGTHDLVDVAGEPLVLGPDLFTTGSGRPATIPAEIRAAAPLIGRALADPDEIRWIWREGSRPQLLRRYIARHANGEQLTDVVVDMAAGGGGASWSARTSISQPLDLDSLRGGVLAYRRPDYGGSSRTLWAARGIYTGDGYAQINRHLRLGEPAPPEVKATIAALDEAIGRSVLAADTVLHRGISGEAAEQLFEKGLRPGTIIADAGFVSTSLEPWVSEEFASDLDGVMLTILAPAGSRALIILEDTAAPSNEHEILLPRGTRLKVLSLDTDTRTLTVELIDGD